jgi:hypothetical protein
MSFKPFYISTFEQDAGVENYFESFLIPEKAFVNLEDAFCWRGKIRKRPGTKFLGRLRRLETALAEPNADGSLVYSVDLLLPLRTATPPEPNAELELLSLSLTIDPSGPGESIYTTPTVTDPTTMALTGGAGGTFVLDPAQPQTINYATGVVTLNFLAVGTPPLGTKVVATFYYFPSLPCMCLQRREDSAINDEQDIAFDTKYAYTFFGTKYIELPSTTPATWSGTDYDLFWTWNYYLNTNGRIYWAANNNFGSTQDPIRYYDGKTWTLFAPLLQSAPATKIYLWQCQVIIAYKNRLIAMNTWEGPKAVGGGPDVVNTKNYVNKIRWSWNGDPTDQVAGWDADTVGSGGYLVAPTNEAILSAGFIRDTLIVKFERSSWKLVYTGNENLPFVFQRVNTDLGCESPFSLITFDKGVLAVGDKGITIDDSVNVSRIDRRVPNIVFDIQNDNEGTARVYGIRDFSGELVYWAYPEGEGIEKPTFPNKVLVYNYVNETWAKFNDSYTCYGYHQKSQDKAWSDYNQPGDTWAQNLTWNTGVNDALFPDVVGGNQQGFVSIISSFLGCPSSNEKTLTISDINVTSTPTELTVYNHNLTTGDFIKIDGVLGSIPDVLNNATTGNIFQIYWIDADTFSLYDYLGNAIGPLSGVYFGGGTIRALNNINIVSKQFSPFYEQGSQCRLGYIDYFISKTNSGQFTADVLIDDNPLISITDSSVNPSLTGSNTILSCPENITLTPYQQHQAKIWHRQFVQAICQNFNLELSFSNEQMGSSTIDASSQDLTIHALAFYLSPNARLVQ